MNEQTIGQMVGKVEHTFSTTSKDGIATQITAVYDCSNASDGAVKGWIAADRTIAYQRTLKKLTSAEILALNKKVVVMDGARRAAVQVDPETAMVNLLKGMTPEAQKAYLEDLAKKAQG